MLTLLRFLTVALAATLVLASGEPPITYNTNRVRLGGLLKRKAGITKDEFLQAWIGHGELFRSTNLTKAVTRYELMPINDTINAMLNASGTLITTYDGLAVFEGESFDIILTALSSSVAVDIIYPNEDTFLDRNATVTMPLNFGIVLDKEPCSS